MSTKAISRRIVGTLDRVAKESGIPERDVRILKALDPSVEVMVDGAFVRLIQFVVPTIWYPFLEIMPNERLTQADTIPGLYQGRLNRYQIFSRQLVEAVLELVPDYYKR